MVVFYLTIVTGLVAYGGFIPQQLHLSPVWFSLVIPLVKTGRLDTRAIPYGDREAIT